MLYLLLFMAGATAWMISTVSAGGAAMLLIPFLGLTMSVQSVAPVITGASLMANPSRTFVFWQHIYWPVIAMLLTGSIIGAIAGAYAFTLVLAHYLQLILGLFLLSTLWQYPFGKRTRSFPMPRWAFFPWVLWSPLFPVSWVALARSWIPSF